MDFLVCFFILALDFRAFGLNYRHLGNSNPNKVAVINYSGMGSGSCPKIVQPLCARNGKKFLYFENKCQLEVKNYEQLIKGSMEYMECPLSYCRPNCGKCNPLRQPVCAINIFTGELEEFANPCEVDHRICTTHQDWQIVESYECNAIKRFKAKTPENSDCPEFCTVDYRPICARYMSLEKEFSNECELKATICQTKQKWHIIKRGPCQQLNYNTNAASLPGPNRPKLSKVPKYNMRSELNTNVDFLPQKLKCSRICSSDYTPVCAKYRKELREFLNNCELERTVCETEENWQLFKKGRCPLASTSYSSCPNFCTKEFNPVCASYNGELREFFNSCEFRKSSCETNIDWVLINGGPCRYEKQKNICQNENLDPICAVLGSKTKTFNNICQLEQEIKTTGNDWSILHKGICNHINSTRKPTPKTSYITTYEPSYKATAKTEISTEPTEKTIYTTASTPITVSTATNIIKTTAAEIQRTTNTTAGDTTAVPETTTTEYTTYSLANTTMDEPCSEEFSVEIEKTSKECHNENESGNSSHSNEDNSSSSNEYNSDDLYDSGSYETQSSKENSNPNGHDEISNANGNNFADFYDGLSCGNETSKEIYETNSKESFNQDTVSVERDEYGLQQQPNNVAGTKLEDSKEGGAKKNGKQKAFSVKEELNTGLSRKKIYQKELIKSLENNATKIVKDNVGQDKNTESNLINSKLQKYFNRKYFVALIEKQLQALFGESSQEEGSEKGSSNGSHRVDYKNKLSTDNPRAISEESLEENISYENYLIASEELSYGLQENEAKLGIHPTSQNQEKINYSENETNRNVLNETNLKDNDSLDLYSTPSVITLQENNGTETTDVLTTDGIESVTNYPNQEGGKSENYNNSERSHIKNNFTTPRKKEIYNGVVYKAPFYEAPTYNFIYTGPHEAIRSSYHNHLKTSPQLNHNSNPVDSGYNQPKENYKILSPSQPLPHSFVPISSEHFSALLKKISPKHFSSFLSPLSSKFTPQPQKPYKQQHKDLAAQDTKMPMFSTKPTTQPQEYLAIASHEEPSKNNRPPVDKQYSSTWPPVTENFSSAALNATLLSRIVETLRSLTNSN